MIRPVHTQVPGRARYKIDGLFRSNLAKRVLENVLRHHREITRVSANTMTGSVLVHHNSGNDHNSIARLISKVLAEAGIPQEIEAFQNRVPPEADAPRKKRDKEAKPSRSKRGDPGQVEPEWKAAARTLIPARGQKEADWHLLAPESVLSVLDADRRNGLAGSLALRRLQELGANTLPETDPRSGLSIFLGQFASLPVVLLGVAAGLSVFTGGVADAVIIMGVVVLNAAIGSYTERESERTINSLKKVIHPDSEVVRDGQPRRIPGREIVPGDLLLLKPGTYIPADSRLVEAEHLRIDESALTGESMPSDKSEQALKARNVPLAERTNMAYMGTIVTGGTGLAVAVHTGVSTEIGRLQIMLQETEAPETPIERQIGKIGDQLVLLCGGICGVVFLIGFARGYGLMQMLRTAISLAAAAVPEGLPAAATITFALGIKKMRAHHILVRQLQAVETIGAIQTICLDKTGTITCNRMAVQMIYAGTRRIDTRNGEFRHDEEPVLPLDVEEVRRLMEVCVLCSETEIKGKNHDNGEYLLSGSPTENALIHLATKAGIDGKALRKAHRLLKITLRSEDRLHMATVHDMPGGGRLYAVKGSPMEVLAMCDNQMINGCMVCLSDEDRIEIQTENERMAGRSLRVLGAAYGLLDESSSDKARGALTWLGLVGMADPIREGVGELIQVFHSAGIETVMITGDQSPTAYAVAKELRLGRDDCIKILDSSELVSVEPEVLQALAKEVQVFSRVTPSHKLKIVQALQAAGKTVAMTGDGINDGPALKAADIGIAMGKSGTDIAREVADVVLEKDNLETLIEALRDGRATYTNIRKSIRFFISTNLSEIIVMGTAMATGIGFPLNAMQLLWINLISDIFPGLALSMEAPETDVLKDPPRDPDAPLFTAGDYKRMARESTLIGAAALGAYGYGIAKYGRGAAAAGTLAFHGLTIAQLLHAYSCRSEKRAIWDRGRSPSNPYLNIAIGGSLLLQLLTVFVPGMRGFLGLSALSAMDMAVVAGSALLPLALNEAVKKTTRVRHNEK